jgi:4-hydroxy-2-oxoheptanedioate aldolase
VHALGRGVVPVSLRAKLESGGPAIGLWASIPTALTAEAAALAGPDYVVVDQQHGAVDPATLTAMLTAVAGVGVTPLVRVARSEPFWIGQALDLGAAGVIVPMVESGEEAASAVAACRYAPEGIRSFGALRAGAGERPLCLVMIETRTGLERAAEIAATPGLDGIYVGPSDLALSLGLQPTIRLEHPPVLEALGVIRAACADAGVVAGVHCLAAEDVPAQAERFAMVTAGGDALHLQGALAVAMRVARG